MSVQTTDYGDVTSLLEVSPTHVCTPRLMALSVQSYRLLKFISRNNQCSDESILDWMVLHEGKDQVYFAHDMHIKKIHSP